MPDAVAARSDDNLESKLAGFVRAYIQTPGDCDWSERQEALRWVCAGLERLLGGMLQQHEESQRFCWVDGILPGDILSEPVKVLSPVELTLHGLAIWGENVDGPFWIEPFFASLRISDSNETIISYDLGFGDAIRGLGTVPYGKHLRRADWFFPTEWVFRFSKEASKTGG